MKPRYLLLLFIFSVSTLTLFSHALPVESYDRPTFAHNIIKIQLTEDAYKLTDVPDQMYSETESFQIEELDVLLSEIGVSKIIRAHRRVKDTTWELRIGFHRWFLITVPEQTDILKTIDYLKSAKQIANAIPEHLGYPDFVPNDPYYPNNWGHNNTAQLPSWVGGYYDGSHSGPPVGTVGFDCRTQFAWDDSQFLGSPDIVIGIIDTGVDLFHPDLRWVPGYDFGDNDNNPMPDVHINSAAHGTNCAGIAAARGNNNLGVTGIAAGCSIMPLKVTTYEGYWFLSRVVNALTYAADNSVDICSMSFGFDLLYGESPTADAAISYAYNQGVVLFASSGNASIEYQRHYPSNHPQVIRVGAASPCGERKNPNSCDGEYWWGSTYGPNIQDHHAAVDIMAPTILPTTDIMGADGYDPGDYYLWYNGTSCSAPYAAGVAALLLSKYPNLSPDEVRTMLTSTATDMYHETYPGWDRYTGYGMVNAQAALTAASFIWNGIYSSNWHDYRNWNNGVPSIYSDVFITNTGLGRYNPVISSEAAYCKSLNISTGATLTVQSHNLTVDETLYVTGNLLITGNVDVAVNGVVRWGYGATANITHSGAELYFHKNMYFHEGSNINITNGTLVYAGDTGAGIYVFATAQIHHLRNAKTTVAAVAGFAATSTNDFYINGNFTNPNDRVFRYYSPRTLHLKGNFINGIYSVFYFDAGTLCFEGPSTQSLQSSSIENNYFHNLMIGKESGTTLNLELTNTSYIEVKGDLTINSGIFNCNNKSIYVKGNWYNNAGEASFVEGDGAVIFSGTGNQFIYNIENFGTLVLNKPSGEIIFPLYSTVTCQKYNWISGTLRVDGGTFVAGRLINPGVYGTIYVDSGLLDMRQNDEIRMDLNADVYMSGGTFYLSGGNDNTNIWGNGVAINVAMTGGVLDFLNQSIIIDTGSDVSVSITGGIVRSPKNYICTKSDINLTGGTLELYDWQDANIQLHSSSSVYNLVVNKGSVSQRDNLRLSTLYASSNLQINGILTISQGIMNLRGYNLSASGGISVHGLLKKNMAGSISTFGDFIWHNGSIADITNGTITCGGNWRFLSGCNVDLAFVTTYLNSENAVELTASSSNAWFGALNISGGYTSPNASLTLDPNSSQNLIIKGVCTIEGNKRVIFSGSPVRLDNNLQIFGTCVLNIGPDTVVSIADEKTLTVNNGSTLEIIGVAGHPATITHQTGYYGFNIESQATIKAEYATFEYMNLSGINCKHGSIVDPDHPFHYCTFVNGEADGTLLTMNNYNSVTIYNAIFPANTWAGTYNVTRSVPLSFTYLITFVNASGDFAGEVNENDVNNRINWIYDNCDLTISDIWSYADELYVCEEATYGIEIYNMSPSPTYVPVRVDLFYNRDIIPAVGEIGDLYVYVDALDAWEAVSIELIAVPSETPGLWRSWFRLDTLNEIVETNENNNAEGYLSTSWLSLPPVTNTTINYNHQTGQVELNWTWSGDNYPTINGFNIYRSISPLGPFDFLTGTSNTTSYSEPSSGAMQFYQIRVEKSWP